MLSTTTAEDDGDESDSSDDEDEYGGSADEQSPHVRFAVPLATRLDEIAAAERSVEVAESPHPPSRSSSTASNQTPGVAAATAPTLTPTYPPRRPAVVLTDAEFIASMTRRSAARPQTPIDGVEILPERFEQFQSDTPDEFYRANWPPYAPRIADRALQNARKWKAMEIYDNFDLKSMDWYAFLELVTGYTDNDDVSEFAQSLTYGERTGLIAPTRVGDRPGLVGVLGSATTASGAGVIDVGVAGMLSPERPPISVDGAPSGLFSGLPRPSAPPLSTRTAGGDSGDSLPHGFPADFTAMMNSTGRLKPERAELLEKLHAPDFLDNETPDDRNRRRQERLDLVRALPSINRPLATGVFLLNPKYIAALNGAYTKIQVYAGPDTSLRNVPMSEFMRRRSTRETGGDTASESVRQTFAELVACYIFLAHDSRHRGNQFKSDRQANEDRANELLRLLRNRFGYDAQRRVFYDVTPRNDERYQARCVRYSARHAGSIAPFSTVYLSSANNALPSYLFPVGASAYRPV